MFVPMAVIQSAPISANVDASWQRDLAAFDAELVNRKTAFASKQLSSECKEDVKQILSHLNDLDQMRKYVYVPYEHGYGGTPSEQAFLVAFLPRMKRVDEENLRTFKALLDRWGWFNRTAWGDKADSEAWLLADHADSDLSFQKRVLGLLEPLVKSGKTDPSHFAYLFDRVAVNGRRLQRFGTQGYCVGPGKWTPRPMEDPEHVDERRKAAGLPPLADYIASFQDICREDETQRALQATGLPVK